ncbi:hypothetical protein CP8484711_1434A, partial [Chlamydia psittaci 84-8471/1]
MRKIHWRNILRSTGYPPSTDKPFSTSSLAK